MGWLYEYYNIILMLEIGCRKSLCPFLRELNNNYTWPGGIKRVNNQNPSITCNKEIHWRQLSRLCRRLNFLFSADEPQIKVWATPAHLSPGFYLGLEAGLEHMRARQFSIWPGWILTSALSSNVWSCCRLVGWAPCFETCFLGDIWVW